MAEKREAKKILIISSDKNLREVLKFCFEGWSYKVILYESSPKDIASIKKASPDVIVVDVYAAKRPDLEICRLLKDDFITAFIPVVTLINKRQLRSQLLNIKQGVDDYLIKPPDPLDLRVRVEMAMKRSQYSFYASSLTGLPGGRIVEENLGERLKSARPFTFGYLDLDNFKYFNDAYGYVKGDRAIMQTAYMLYSIISKYGNRDDFIGHIGGDDFAFITTPEKYNDICYNFISEFNRIIPFHYSAEDRPRGYVIARDRTHKIKNIPLMTVSIAVVNTCKYARYGNVIEINERIAEVKRYLKSFEGSKFMADRRSESVSGKTAGGNEPHIFPLARAEDGPFPEEKDGREFRRNSRANRAFQRNAQAFPSPEAQDGRAFQRNAQAYRPLGQILLERGSVSNQDLDEALCAHWRRGIRLGEIISELGLVSDKELAEALKESERYLKIRPSEAPKKSGMVHAV